jgi:hypothetical protein
MAEDMSSEPVGPKCPSCGEETTQPSPAMVARAARLLLTKRGELPEVHAAWKEPLEPFCGNLDGFGPGGYSTYTLRITCQACNDKSEITEEQLAEWERWTREGLPAGYRTYKPVRTATGWDFEERIH